MMKQQVLNKAIQQSGSATNNMLNNTVNSFSQKLQSASRNVFWLSLWLIGLFLILIYPARWLLGDSLRPVRMVSYITPWLLYLSLPFLIIAGVGRRRWLAGVLAMATLANVLTFAPLFLPRHRVTPTANDFSLKIMS